MFKKLFNHFSADLAIDLGTANTLIWNSQKGLVLNEPSVVAIRTDLSNGKRSIVAVGTEAKQMLGKVPGNIEAIRPMKDGVIANFTATEQMLKSFIKLCSGRTFGFSPPRIVICVPSGSTQVERRAIRESAIGAGANQVFLIEETMAAAIGAGLPVADPFGSMVIDIGGGTTEIGIISLGGTVYAESIRVGGDKIDDAITSYIRRNFGMAIGDSTAERIKTTIGCAYPCKIEEEEQIEVKGRDMASGLPKTITITSNNVLEALNEPLNQIVQAVKNALEKAPPEVAADLAERGMFLTGGGAFLKRLDKLISQETGLPVFIAEDPLLCVVKGCGQSLQHLDKFGGVFISE